MSEPTTQLLIDPVHADAAPFVQIPENPPLIAPAARISAIRITQTGIETGRTASED